MARETPEWIGKTDDSAIPPRVRLRIFEHHSGHCFLTGRIIRAGEQWDLDHRVALVNGGQHRESNLVPVLTVHHRLKTKKDVAEKSMVARKRKKHLGIRKPSRFPGAKTSRWKKKISGEVVER